MISIEYLYDFLDFPVMFDDTGGQSCLSRKMWHPEKNMVVDLVFDAKNELKMVYQS